MITDLWSSMIWSFDFFRIIGRNILFKLIRLRSYENQFSLDDIRRVLFIEAISKISKREYDN